MYYALCYRGCIVNLGTLRGCIDKVEELKDAGAVGFCVIDPDTGELIYE